MNTTRTLIHDAQINGCGGTFTGDWEEVECMKCGMRFQTLDVPNLTNGRLTADEVLRFSTGSTLVAVTVA